MKHDERYKSMDSFIKDMINKGVEIRGNVPLILLEAPVMNDNTMDCYFENEDTKEVYLVIRVDDEELEEAYQELSIA